MLVHLSIRNLAVIESVQLSFRHGFQVLTGETGAGKSIVIDALTLIAGGRGSSEWVRYGTDKAEIEALFEIVSDHPVWAVLERIGITAASEESLIIRRDLSAQGKSTSRINGQLVNLTMLREVGEWLVNIHGQHEHQSLLKAEEHMSWLDAFGGVAIEGMKQQYQASYDRYIGLNKQLAALEETSKQALQMRDLYLFQVDEITEADLKPAEDELLEEEKRKLSYAEKLFQNSSEAYDAIHANKSGLDAINKSIQRLQEIAGLDPSQLKPLLDQVQSAFYQLEDAAFQLRDYRDQIEFNPKRIDQIETRLHLIASFRRKYGVNVMEILQYLHKIQDELQLIENKDELLLQIQENANAELKIATSLAYTLSKQRQKSATILASEIERELRDLQMERTRFSVRIERLEDKLTRNGCDQVEFLISANPGEPLRPMSKIASGGELSRIMLAMKSIFAKVDRIPVLVFDEVDTGVSGRAAQAIAEKLSVLSGACQVFSITHLPQVACMADAHYLIQKIVEGERTFTQVEDLNVQGQVNELARMLGGVEITETTLEHAQEMLRMANQKKKDIQNVKV
ncbi:DNA repair protein RecN [Paenibacillus psychroresistens]|uniref:DNA repair protein RecN n=1 Tax=Paenibacillus psychroresistens TaxID=1778678 RepID=A0A6B8RL22_9BACL|nr:DNA repair protein RecN [Paenibacillus psychroresistens]QGQ97091.1 DNA repair protein RecN [Paenibacillus psychroresistens]